MSQYWGKYPGTVIKNVDPERRGRIQVACSAVFGEGMLAWALPCVPFAGRDHGLYLMPDLNSNVWLEFQGGNPQYPIWVGCFWGIGEAPSMLATQKILRGAGVSLVLDELPGSGGITLEVGPPVSPGAKVTMTATGVEVSFGKNKVSLTASSVSVNDGALEVI